VGALICLVEKSPELNYTSIKREYQFGSKANAHFDFIISSSAKVAAKKVEEIWLINRQIKAH